MPIPIRPSARTVWALTTGEAGNVSQAEGLAEALGWPFQRIVVRLRRPWSWLPAHRQPPGLLRYGLEQTLPQPWPDILIGCGRRSASVSAAIRRAAGGRTFTVQILDPRAASRTFDLVVPPAHDGLTGPNVVATRAALHRITPEKLAAAEAEWRGRLGRPSVAVMLGGRSRSYRFTRETIDKLAGALAKLDGDIAVTASRRTEPGVIDALKSRLPKAWFWDSTGPNPYLGMLASARHIVVTEDSVSMISEAISTGKPVYVARMAGGSRRLARFHASLRDDGIVRPFDGRLAQWRYEPVNETPRIAAEVRRRMEAAAAARSAGWTRHRGMPLSQGLGRSATVPQLLCSVNSGRGGQSMTEENRNSKGAGRTRRDILKAGAAGAVGTAALSAGFPSIVRAADAVRIGYVSPKTGPLAPFAEADEFNVASVLEAIGGKVETAGGSLDVEIIVKDSQSNPNRAAEVASELILSDEVHLLCAGNTPETTNPVADQAEINEVPCVTTLCPWQPYFFGRGGNPAEGFQWTYHYFWGLEDIIAVFLNLWGKIETNKVVGGLYPNDGDGNAWGDPELGFPKPLAAAGYTLIDPGRYQNLSDDFSAQISEFKDNGAEIVTGVVLPPDFTTFWTQSAQQGFRPKAATVGKALLFPVSVEALGDAGHNLSSEIWWSPSHPFTSSITGQSCGELAAAFTAATGKQWSQPVGYGHSIFEVALDVVSRAEDINDTGAMLASIVATNVSTIAGPVSWGSGPVKNVAKMPLVGGQWRRTPDGPFGYDLIVTSNETAPDVPVGGEMEVIG